MSPGRQVGCDYCRGSQYLAEKLIGIAVRRALESRLEHCGALHRRKTLKLLNEVLGHVTIERSRTPGTHVASGQKYPPT
jgi:hypothetical protein